MKGQIVKLLKEKYNIRRINGKKLEQDLNFKEEWKKIENNR